MHIKLDPEDEHGTDLYIGRGEKEKRVIYAS